MGKDKKKRSYGSAKDVADRRSSGANYGYIKIPKDVKMFTPEADTVAVIDILPYEVSDKNHMDKIEVGTMWYKKPFKVHKGVGPNNDSYVCPTTFGKACPICEHGEELRRNEGDEKEIEKTRSKFRNLYAVIVKSYDGKKQFDKNVIHLFDFSDFLFQEVFETQLKKKKQFDTFFLPEEGFSLEITFDEGSYGGGKFAKTTRVDFIERKKQYDESILDKVPNLDKDVLTVLSYDELEAKFFGDDVDTTEDEQPKKDKKDKKNKKEKKDKEESEPDTSQETTTSGTKKDKKGKKKDKEEPTTAELIEQAETTEDLLTIVKTYPVTFDKYKKELKQIEKVKKLKKRMLEIMDSSNAGEGDDLPFNKTADKKEEGKKEKSKDTCPYDHKFGKDCDKFADCEDCDLWNECKAAKKASKKDK